MARTVFLIIFSCMSVILSAQEDDVWFDGTLKELFSLMQTKFNVRFMYSNNDIDDNRIVSLRVDQDLKTLMNKIAREINVAYEINNNQVVLKSFRPKTEDARIPEKEEETTLVPEKEKEEPIAQMSETQIDTLLRMPVMPITFLDVAKPFQSKSIDKIALVRKKHKTSFSDMPTQKSSKIKTNEFSLYTNLLYDLILTPNIGFGYKMNETFEILIDGAWSHIKWDNGNKTYRLRMLSPELRVYPLRNKRYYLGAIGHIGALNIKLSGTGYQGYFRGGGITAGYAKEISNRFSIDFGMGFGCVWFDYDSYSFADGANTKEDSKKELFWIPAKASVSLTWRSKTFKKVK